MTFGTTPYKITKIHDRLPIIMYSLQNDSTKQHMNGRYYANELSLYRPVDFKVVKTLKTKKVRGKTMHLVQFRGYEEQEPSWIAASDITAEY